MSDPSAASSYLGRELGGFRLTEVVGEGGMGAVFRAQNLRVEKLVRAVKLIRPDFASQPDFRERFLREAEFLELLHHPNILRVDNIGEEGGVLFLVMELLDGETVDHLVARSPLGLPPGMVGALLTQALAGIGHAHASKIIHRDLKPANLFLTSGGVVKVLDFGIARHGSSDRRLTDSGQFTPGSPAYYAPEFLDGVSASPSSDLYALGITLFELLTGRLPYQAGGGSQGQAMVSLLAQHAQKPLPDPREFQPELPAPLVEVVRRACAKQPAERYPDAAAFAQALAGALGPLPALEPAASPGSPSSVTTGVDGFDATNPSVSRRASEGEGLAGTYLTPRPGLQRQPLPEPPPPPPTLPHRRRRAPFLVRAVVVLALVGAYRFARVHLNARLSSRPAVDAGATHHPATMKEANALMDQGHLIEAAETYLAFVDAVQRGASTGDARARERLAVDGDEALFQAGSCFEKAKLPERAAPVYARLVELFPASSHASTARLREAEIAADSLDGERAIRAFRELLEKAPHSAEAPRAQEELIATLELDHRYKEAGHELQAMAGGDVEHLLRAAELDEKGGDAESAAAAVKLIRARLTGADGASLHARVLLARAELVAGDEAAARSALEASRAALHAGHSTLEPRDAETFAEATYRLAERDARAAEVAGVAPAESRRRVELAVTALDTLPPLATPAWTLKAKLASAHALVAQLSTLGASATDADRQRAEVVSQAVLDEATAQGKPGAVAAARLDLHQVHPDRFPLEVPPRSQYPVPLLFPADAPDPTAAAKLNQLGHGVSWEQGADEAREGLAKDPRDSALLRELAWCAVMLERPELAEAALTHLFAQEPNDLLGLHLQAALLRAQGKSGLAAEQRAARGAPAWAEAHNNLGVLLLEAGKAAEAQQALEQALRNEPDFPSARLNLGNALAAQGKPALAIEQYDKAGHIDGSLRDLSFNLGVLYLEGSFPELSPSQRGKKANDHLLKFAYMGGHDPHLAMLLVESQKLMTAKP